MKKKKLYIIISLILILAIASGCLYFFVFRKTNKSENASANATSINTRIEILQSQLGKVQEDLLKISTGDNASVIENKFDELSTRISEVANNLSSLAGEVLRLKEVSQSNYETLLTKVEDIEGSLIEIKSDLSELKTLSTRVETLEASIQTLTNKIVALENNSADEAELQEVRQQLAVIQAELNILKANSDNSIKTEVIFDCTSNLASLNWGYVEGIKNNVKITGKDFSKYKSLIVYHEAGSQHYVSINDLTKPTVTNNYYNQVCVEVVYDNDMAVTRACIVGSDVNSDKTAITCKTFFRRITQQTEITTDAYFVYKIVGIY